MSNDDTRTVTIELPEAFVGDLLAAFPAATDATEAACMAIHDAVAFRGGPSVRDALDADHPIDYVSYRRVQFRGNDE